MPYRASIPLRSRHRYPPHRRRDDRAEDDAIQRSSPTTSLPPFARNCSKNWRRKREVGRRNRSPQDRAGEGRGERGKRVVVAVVLLGRPRRPSGRGGWRFEPSVFAPSRGTRSSRISETLRHSPRRPSGSTRRDAFRFERALPLPLLFLPSLPFLDRTRFRRSSIPFSSIPEDERNETKAALLLVEYENYLRLPSKQGRACIAARKSRWG